MRSKHAFNARVRSLRARVFDLDLENFLAVRCDRLAVLELVLLVRHLFLQRRAEGRNAGDASAALHGYSLMV